LQARCRDENKHGAMVCVPDAILTVCVGLCVSLASAVGLPVHLQSEPAAGHEWQLRHLHSRLLELTVGSHGVVTVEQPGSSHPAAPVPTHAGLVRRAGSSGLVAHQLPHHITEHGHRASSFVQALNSTNNSSSSRHNESTLPRTSVTSGKQMSAMVPTLLSFAVLVLFIVSQVDFVPTGGQEPADAPRTSLSEEAAASAAAAAEPPPDADTGGTATMDQRPERGILVITTLTCYKFYMGFLNGTYVPFLVAKEGVSMTQDRQSLFMGVIKLIYGFSMFMNPALGLISDKLAQGSVRHGRSIFMLTGVVMEGTALVAAKLASENREIGWYIAACCTWMLGEAFSDVVVEALPLEILPPRQYNLASSIRSLHFFGGALSGYIALFFLHDLHYDWLYWAYLGLMLTVAVPSLVMARVVLSFGQEHLQGPEPPRAGLRELLESYITPLYYPGYFPPSVLATFIFCLGTPPLYFTLLMVRDLVGITDEGDQQKQFSGISMIFLSCAVLSAAVAGSSKGAENMIGPEAVDAGQADGVAEASAEASASGDSGADTGASSSAVGLPDHAGEVTAEAGVAARIGSEGEAVMWTLLTLWCSIYGMICFLAPVISVPSSIEERLKMLYVLSGFFGLTFGSVYSRFKACTWITLPPGADVANAMGVASVGQITGTGIGNFIAGCILDAFGTHGKAQYDVKGYLVMSWGCAVAVFSSIVLLSRIMRNRGMQRPSIRKLLFW